MSKVFAFNVGKKPPVENSGAELSGSYDPISQTWKGSVSIVAYLTQIRKSTACFSVNPRYGSNDDVETERDYS